MSNTPTLYLLPCPIAEGNNDSLSKEAIDAIHSLTYFVVERARTARRFIKTLNHPKPIQELIIFELDKRDPKNGLHDFLNHLKQGHSIGILSEAGCPGIADPGALSVDWAHKNDIRVRPLVGPSSILLGLIASGMNGQNFAFNGYLPNKSKDLGSKLKQLEAKVVREKQSQIFMEAPYRNSFILENCINTLSPNIALCIACDINAETEFIKTKKVKDWKGYDWSDLHKRPCIFIIGETS